MPWISLSEHIPVVLHELPDNLPSPRMSTSNRREQNLGIIGPHLLLRGAKDLHSVKLRTQESRCWLSILHNIECTLKIEAMNIECAGATVLQCSCPLKFMDCVEVN